MNIILPRFIKTIANREQFCFKTESWFYFYFSPGTSQDADLKEQISLWCRIVFYATFQHPFGFSGMCRPLANIYKSWINVNVSTRTAMASNNTSSREFQVKDLDISSLSNKELPQHHPAWLGGKNSGEDFSRCPLLAFSLHLVEKWPAYIRMHHEAGPQSRHHHLYLLIVLWGEHGSSFVWEDKHLGLIRLVVSG